MNDRKMTFRIDDVSLNTNGDELLAIAVVIRERFPLARVILAVSPLVHGMADAGAADCQRAFPRRLSAMSDHRRFFGVHLAGSGTGPLHGQCDLALEHALQVFEIHERDLTVDADTVRSLQ